MLTSRAHDHISSGEGRRGKHGRLPTKSTIFRV